MKTHAFICSILLLALFPALCFSQVSPERKLIATLSPGEFITNSESCFFLDKDPAYISFVTYIGSGDSKQYYHYGNDGKKTGPFKSPDPSLWAQRNNENIEDCLAETEPKQGEPEKYIDFTTGSVKFKGKNYGPYGQLTSFFLSEDEQNFYATALSEEMKITFFDNRNRNVELVTLPDKVLISPDGSRSYALVKGSINPFDPDAAQKMMSNPEEMNNPKINLVGIDGSKFGPYTSDTFTGAWFSPSGKLVVYNNHEISLEGKLLFKSDDFISKCDIWVSNNGKDYAWADYEHLMFSDGTKFVAPLVISYTETGGKGFLKWIALEEGKHVVLYSKVF
jgi:hypothetical protein